MSWEELIYFLIYFLQGCIVTLYLCRLLEARFSIVVTFAATSVLYSLVFVPFRISHFEIVYTHRTLAMAAVWILCLFLFFRGKVFLRIFALASAYMLAFLGEITITFVMHGVLKYSFEESMQYPVKMYGQLAALICFLLLTSITAPLLQKYIFRRQVNACLSPKNMLLFLLFPTAQTLLLFACSCAMASGLHQFSFAALLLGILFCACADILMFHTMVETAQKARLEQQLAEAEYTARIQEGEYSSILAAQQLIARYRHDNKGRLSTAVALLHSERPGALEDAVQLLGEMSASLEPEHGQFCANLTVDATVSSKMQDCRSADIRLQSDLLVPENLPIEKLHLCSLFSNILDNAISACRALPPEERKIQLSAALDGGFLMIREENPLPPVPPQKGHGLGMKILNSIVQQYHGEMIIEQQDHHFHLLIALSLSSSETFD